MNEKIENIIITILIMILLLLVPIPMIIGIISDQNREIELLKQSLNEQIIEKQIYMNMLEKERSKVWNNG